MAAPTLTASLDKASYAPGDTVTLTVNYGDTDNSAQTVTIKGTDSTGLATTVTLQINVADPVALAVTDDGGRAWAKVSDSGAIAVYTTKA